MEHAWIVFIALVVIIALFILMSAIIALGITSTRFQQLKKGPLDPFIYASLWLAATLVPLPLIINSPKFLNLYIIGLFINLLWTLFFFYVADLKASAWLVVVIFVYQFILAGELWAYSPFIAAFMLPVLLFDILLFYNVVHLAVTNGVFI